MLAVRLNVRLAEQHLQVEPQTNTADVPTTGHLQQIAVDLETTKSKGCGASCSRQWNHHARPVQAKGIYSHPACARSAHLDVLLSDSVEALHSCMQHPHLLPSCARGVGAESRPYITGVKQAEW